MLEKQDIIKGLKQIGLKSNDVVLVHSAMRTFGPKASMITEVDPELCVFGLRSSFGKMLELDSKVLILRMTYQISTSHHFAEYIWSGTLSPYYSCAGTCAAT